VRLKFLESAPSSAPDAPFQAGQTVDVATLSPEMRAALTAGSAILLPETAAPVEAAVVDDDAVDRAVLPRARARKP
jgi:hypothetical protein